MTIRMMCVFRSTQYVCVCAHGYKLIWMHYDKAQGHTAVASVIRQPCVCVCVCVCVCCYICIVHIYIHVCVCIYIYIYMHVCIFVCVYIYIYIMDNFVLPNTELSVVEKCCEQWKTCVFVCVYIHMYVYVYSCICVHVNVYICSLTYKYIQIYTYIQIHTDITYMHIQMELPWFYLSSWTSFALFLR